MTAGAIDDLEARPGSVTSLLRTVLATYARPLGGWIAPERLAGEVEEVLEDIGALEHCTLFAADEVRPVRGLRASVVEWWDFTGLGALHRGFLDLLPAGWPGLVTTRLYSRLRGTVAPFAAQHVRATTGIATPCPSTSRSAHVQSCA